MRDRFVAILCFAVLAALFAVPAAIWAVFLPSLRQGLPNPIPGYERMLLDLAILCGSWKWVLGVPLTILGSAFTIMASTRRSR